jgi:hypothetical protein
VDEMYSNKTSFEIEDKDGNYVEVKGMVIKSYPIIKLTTESGKVVKPAESHVILTTEGQKYTEYLEVGDILYNRFGNEKIVKIEKLPEELVYDLAVDNETKLYSDAQGFVHHNTFHVEKTLTEMLGVNQGPNAKWRHRKGSKTTTLGLYTDLFLNRDDMVIVYDDSDSVLLDKDTVNMLKSALDTGASDRYLSYSAKGMTVNVDNLSPDDLQDLYLNLDIASKESPEDIGSKLKLPNTFLFNSRIIFISNLPLNKVDSAIRSRSFVVDVTLKREDVINRIKTILKHSHSHLSEDDRNEVVEKLSQSSNQLTMRSVTAALAIKEAGLNDWSRLSQMYA